MRKRVFDACNKLAEQGIKPTLISVRNELGGGSFSTINPFLKQWKEEKKVDGSQTNVDLHHELATINRKMMDMIWKATDEHCNKVVREQYDDLETLRIYAFKADVTISKLRQELNEVKKEKATLEGMLIMHYKNMRHKSSS